MKKILAVSLCAIMAVSAARAEIASVEYVDEQITEASSTINSSINTLTQTVGTKAAQADLTTLSGTVSTNKVAADKTQEDLDTLEATVAGLTTGDNSVAGQIDAKIGAMDLTEVKESGKAIVSVSQTDGKVSATLGQVGTAGIVDSAVTTAKIADGAVNSAKIVDGSVAKEDLTTDVQTSLGLADSALQKADIITGTGNGTIAVEGTDVAVKGLGTAAYTASTAYATSAQGAKADTAMQESDLKGLESWMSAKCGTTGVTCSLVSKDGEIAWEAVKY